MEGVPPPAEPPCPPPGGPPAPPGDEPPGDLLDDYRALRDPDRRREVERRRDVFVVEGRFALEALLDSPYPVRSVLVAEPKAAAIGSLVAGRAPLVVVPAAEMAAITGFRFHRGVVAAAGRLPPPPLDEVLATDARTVAVLEGLNDHENLGALFRNAAAFGVGAVLLDPTTADPLYRRSVRVSAGHVLRVPWTRLAWPGDLAGLRDRGFRIVALTPAPDADPIDRLAADRPRRVAFLLGAEGPGLSDVALAAADQRVRIPIAPGVDSLNVATAAAIAFHAVAAALPVESDDG
jgi:tRNA G18 (ribose-2'-O)-methylase SpoU